MLPDQIWTVNPKIIYVYRQPKDVAVSYFHHHTILDNYVGGIQEYVDCFVNDFLLWSPYHEHISGGLELNEILENTLVTKYENMKKDLPSEIKRTIKFLALDYSDDQILELAEHLSIDNMKSIYSIIFFNQAAEIHFNFYYIFKKILQWIMRQKSKWYYHSTKRQMRVTVTNSKLNVCLNYCFCFFNL